MCACVCVHGLATLNGHWSLKHKKFLFWSSYRKLVKLSGISLTCVFLPLCLSLSLSCSYVCIGGWVKESVKATTWWSMWVFRVVLMNMLVLQIQLAPALHVRVYICLRCNDQTRTPYRLFDVFVASVCVPLPVFFPARSLHCVHLFAKQ